MIIYKYVDFLAGIEILTNNTIGFRQPIHLNDPMELSAAYPIDDYIDEKDYNEMRVRRALKDYFWRTNYAILSLTRAPNNPLMWAHYSQNHKGFVIGFEINIDILSSEEFNIIPAQYGNVIYTTTKPIHEFISKSERVIEIGNEVAYIPERFENLQRIFLYKPMCWAYEEEVRVVKNISKKVKGKYKSGNLKIIKVNGNDLYISELPKNTIKTIYFGFRNPLIQKINKDTLNLIKIIRAHSTDIKLFICRPGERTWNFEYFPLEFE